MARTVVDLEAWQLAVELSACIHLLAETFPAEDITGFSAQLRRASLAVPSSIAGGWRGRSRQELLFSLALARGNTTELKALLAIAQLLGFGDPDLLASTAPLVDEVGRELRSLARRLN